MDYVTGSAILLKAYEKQSEEIQFNSYMSYRIEDRISKQLQALGGAKNIDPILSYDEWKKPVKTDCETSELLTEEEKEEIRKHTRNFGKRR